MLSNKEKELLKETIRIHLYSPTGVSKPIPSELMYIVRKAKLTYLLVQEHDKLKMCLAYPPDTTTL